MAKANDKDELNAAMARGESTIEIEGDFARKVIRLKATGNVAWGVAAGAIAVAVAALVMMTPATIATGGAAAPVEAVAVAGFAAPAVSILGLDAVVMAVGLAVASGGVGVLTRLRSDYKIIEQAPDRVVLAKI